MTTRELCGSGGADGTSSASVALQHGNMERVQRSADLVGELRPSEDVVYGVSTGFGYFSTIVLSPTDQREVQYNIIRSHACGVGPDLPRDIVHMMWLIQLSTLSQGYSGVRPETLLAVKRALEAGFLGCVPSRGSVGASGDLAPQAHAVLALIGEGWCTIPVETGFARVPASEGLERCGLLPMSLGPKEGLALINGTALSTALAAKAWHQGGLLLSTANVAAAMMMEAMRAQPGLLDQRLLSLHRHPGTITCGRELRALRELPGEERDPPLHLQDAYCLRCAPQVHGAVLDELVASEQILDDEIAAIADNPLVFAETGEMISGGNFHAIYPARVSDRIASALTTLSSISERRTNKAMNEARSGLPTFLIRDGGLHSGFMMAHVTAAALVSECKSLAFPASVDSISTNCDQEDHVSMGPAAGHKALQVADYTARVLAIELMAAAQALDLLSPPRLPVALKIARDRVRALSPFLEQDRSLSEEIERVAGAVLEGTFARLCHEI